MSSPFPASLRRQQNVDADGNRSFPFAPQPPLRFSPSGFHLGPSVTASDVNSSHLQDASQTTSNFGSSPTATRSTGTTAAQGGFGQSSQVGGERTTPTSLFGHTSPPVAISAADFFGQPPSAPTSTQTAAGPESGIFSPIGAARPNSSSLFGQTPSPSSFSPESAQSNSGTFGASTQSSSIFGGLPQSSSTFGASPQSGGAFGGSPQSDSTFGGSTQSGSTLGGSTQSGSTLGGSTQSGSTLGGSTQSGSTLGGSTQSGSTLGGSTQSGSNFGISAFGQSMPSGATSSSLGFRFGRLSTSGTSSGGDEGEAIGGFGFNSPGPTTAAERSATEAGGSLATAAGSDLAASGSGTGFLATLSTTAAATSSPSATRSPMFFTSDRPVPGTTARRADRSPTAAVGTRHVAFQITNVGHAFCSENLSFHSITAMPQYSNKSFEELRMEDYAAGHRGSLGEDQDAETGEAETEYDFDTMENRLKDLMDDFRRLKDEHRKRDDGMNCLLCLSQRKCVALMPCRHLCLCEECSKHPSMDACPLCRNSITDKLVVFL